MQTQTPAGGFSCLRDCTQSSSMKYIPGWGFAGLAFGKFRPVCHGQQTLDTFDQVWFPLLLCACVCVLIHNLAYELMLLSVCECECVCVRVCVCVAFSLGCQRLNPKRCPDCVGICVRICACP
jgi:hypothetical protein